MNKLMPIFGIALRHLLVWKRDINLILAAVYWPLLDIILWGSLGMWIQQTQNSSMHYLVFLLGLLLWQVIGRGCNIMMTAFTEEIWSNNVVNLFSLPLTIGQWIIGVILFFAVMMSISSLYCMAAMLFFYDVTFWELFSNFMLFAPPLFFSAIWIGFTALLVIVQFGKRGIELGYVIIWFLLPFSGAYYPTEILPAWGKMLAQMLPMHYVFKGMRTYLMEGQSPMPHLLQGYAMSIPYAIAAVALFVYCFNRSKEKGLARLTD